MKYYLKRHNRFLAIVLILTGLFLSACIGTKYETKNIHLVLKEKPRLVRIGDAIKEDVLKQVCKNNEDFKSSICAEKFFYKQSEIPDNWQNQYRITLTIKMQYPYSFEIHLAKCNEKEHSILVNGFITEQTAQYNVFQIYLNIERLKQLGYINADPEKQKDLCLFVYRPYMGNFSKQTKYISNDIVLPADEINELVREYEALQ